MEKTINVGGKAVVFKATASTTRRYRQKFQRDLISDMIRLDNEVNSDGDVSIQSLEMFENIVYIMAKQADDSIPSNPDDWFDEFDMFSIYEVLPQIVELWKTNTETIEYPKKK